MPTLPTPHTAPAKQSSGLYLMSRVVGNDGALVTQASFGTITYTVYDLSTTPKTTVEGPTSLTINSVVFNALQTTTLDPRWTVDTTGYNFAFTVPAADLSKGGVVYWVTVNFAPSSGQPFADAWEVRTSPTTPP